MVLSSWVARWSAQPRFLASLRRWSWCREAHVELLSRIASDLRLSPTIDAAALARAFWQWAAALDSEADMEPLDPVDYAHFQCGMLLSQFVWQRPLHLPDAEPGVEIGVYTDAVLTLLGAWRSALGAPPPEVHLPDVTTAAWASYVENVLEDPTVAVAFLDLFTGREPVWRFPTFPAERPVLRQALEERRRSAA